MNPEPQREEALFQAASQLTGPVRAAFLDQACAKDAALRQRLEALLTAHEASAGILGDEPAQPTMKIEFAEEPADEAVGQTLGRYKLLERVGEGGCGVVYVAGQTEPVRRRVALKVIKLGMDTKQVVARFEAERQALAMMDHPNIAKVLDAGTTDVGRPFFVMELVRGIRITDYCDEAKLSTQERLDLFIKVCQAIQHAHQKGIIHRDIKPSNILVTLHDGVPVPKVIDFGIAKATEGRLTDVTVYTQLHQFIGTPAYMSPEQAEMSGLDIDTRSDIYSLGVLLYELLAGSTPFDPKELMASGIDAMRKTIREKEPVRPSTRLATLKGEELTTTAKRRSSEAPKLIHLVKGDLDWIVMKCLEKDRTRRYETANGLAADLKRHLSNEPVAARPPSATYRFQKAFRRNKLMFSAGTAVVIALAIGLCLAAVGLRQAVRERNSALTARAGEETQRREAQQAQANESRLRREAEVHELATRRRAYASDMNLAQQSIAVNNFGRALELLNQHRPTTRSEIDLRGWEWRYLWQECRSDAAFTLGPKSFEITSLTISPDGNWLAVAEHDKGGLSIWNLRTRQEVERLDAGDGLVLASFSPREPLLAFTVSATNGARNTVRLWNRVTKEIVAELPLGGPARGVKFSADGRTLVTSTVGENQIALWRIPDGRKLAGFLAPQTWDDDGTLLAVAGDLSVAAHSMNDGRIRVIELNTGQERWVGKTTDRHATALEFSPDGKILASGAGFSDRSVVLWDVDSGKEIACLQAHRGYVLAFVFWPDGKTMASASSDQTICIWNLGDPTQVPPPRTLRGHKREVWRLALHSDNDTLISGSQDGSVSFWRTKTARRESSHFTLSQSFKTSVGAWRFAPDGQSILAVTGNRVVHWRGAEFEQMQAWMDLGQKVRGALISSDCKVLATGSDDGVIRIWDLPNRKLLSEMATGPGPAEPRQFLERGSRLLIEHPRNNQFTEWDLASSSRLRSIPVDLPPVYGAAISADGRWFFAGNKEDLDLFDLKTNPSTRRKPGIDSLGSVTFSTDGTLLAAASRNGYTRVWETTSLREVATFRNFRLGVHGVRFSPDGDRLITGSGDQEAIKVFDMESRQELLTLSAQGSQFYVNQPSLDNNLISGRDEQGVVHIWRAPSFPEIATTEARERAENKQP